MSKKLIVIPLLISIFILPLTYSFATQSTSRLVWGYYLEGLGVKIFAPYRAYPGDLITIRVRTEASEDLMNVSINIHLFGSMSEGDDVWYYFVNILNNQNLTTGTVQDQDFDICIPSNLSPGLTYGKVNFSWKVYRYPDWTEQSTQDTFMVTYFLNRQYEELLTNYPTVLEERDYWRNQSNYWQNQSQYWSAHANQSEYWQNQSDHWRNEYDNLYSNYTSLKDNYNNLQFELGNARNLIYVFIATTVIFIVTTVYFALKTRNKKENLWYRRI